MDIKGLTRKNYWDYYAINPLLTPDLSTDDLDAFAHEELSADCHRLFIAGNAEVIFEYAKIDVAAFDEPWVVATIKRWRLENTSESRAKLDRLMHAYTYTPGALPLKTIVDVILRDHQVFKAIITRQLQPPKMPLKTREGREGIYARVASDYNLSEESVAEIYKTYKAKADELMGKKRPRLLSRQLLPKDHNEALQEAFQAIELDQHINIPETPPMASWDEFFRWLDDMAIKLRSLAGG